MLFRSAASEFRAIRRQYEAFGTVGSPAQELGFTYGDITTNTNLAGIWFDNSFADNAASGLSIKASNAAGTVATVGKFSSTGLAVTGALSATGGVTLSGGTANGVAYLDGSKVLTTGSALTFDGATMALGQYLGANGRLNITTASSGTFQIGTYMTNAVDTDFQIRFKTGITDIGTATSTPLTFSYGGSEQMRLTSTGLAIGTTSSTNKLLIDTAVSNAGSIQLPRGAFIGFSNAADNANSEYIYANGGNLELGINGSTQLALTSTGLGLGTSSPAFKLSVQGNAIIGGANPYLAFGSDASVGATPTYIERNGTTGLQTFYNNGTGTNGAMAFVIGAGSEGMRLTSTGLGLGNTSPSYTLDVTGTGRFTKTVSFTEIDNGNSSTADTIDWTQGNKQKSTLTGNCTYTFTAPGSPTSLVFKLVQDATGSRTVTWPAAVKWSGGTAPTLTTTANKVDIITFYYDGTTYFGNATLNFTA